MSVSKFIIYILGALFTISTIFFTFYKNYNKRVFLNKCNIFLTIVQAILIVINNYYNIQSLKFLSAIVITVLFIKIIFKSDLKTAIFFTLINSIVSIAVELITTIFLINISDISTLNNSIFIKLTFSLINCIIVMFVMISNKMKKFIKKSNRIIEQNTRIFINLLYIIFVINIFLVLKSFNISDLTISTLSMVLVFFIFFYINSVITDKYNISLLEEKNINLKNSYEAYSETIEQYREVQHNLKHDLYFIKTSLPRKYQNSINELLYKYNKNYEWINNINNIPEGLQGIIFLKEQEAKKHKILISVNSRKNINNITKDFLDLSNILGILLDNAIEASKISKSKNIDISIVENNSILNIKIINKYINNINLSEIGNKNYSTKKYKSGIGLNYIKNVNNNINVTFNIINDLFITKLTYKKN